MRLRVVLVEPMYEGNVGSVARAMKNFGFQDLVLVNPCPIEDLGLAMASHAKDLLLGARRASSIDEAIEGADLVVGTTGKRLGREQRHLRLYLRAPCLTPEELSERLRDREGTVALLLGREDCGLHSRELALCDMLVSIPTSHDYPVMNLSHASAVLLYELSSLDGGEIGLASREIQQLLLERSRALLREIGYPSHKLEFTVLMLRRIFGRAGLTEREARALLGIIKGVCWRIGSRRQEERDQRALR